MARSVPGACCGCDQRPSLMERRWLYRSLLSLLLPSVLPGSDTVFPHHRMMKSLIVSEDLRKLPPHLSAPAVGAVLLLPLTFFSPPRAARQPPPRLDCASCLLLGGLGGGERGEILDSPDEAPVPSGALLPLAHPRRSQTHRIDPRRSDAPGDALSRAGRTPSLGRAPPGPPGRPRGVPLEGCRAAGASPGGFGGVAGRGAAGGRSRPGVGVRRGAGGSGGERRVPWRHLSLHGNLIASCGEPEITGTTGEAPSGQRRRGAGPGEGWGRGAGRGGRQRGALAPSPSIPSPPPGKGCGAGGGQEGTGRPPPPHPGVLLPPSGLPPPLPSVGAPRAAAGLGGGGPRPCQQAWG